MPETRHLQVLEQDESPDVLPVHKIFVPNISETDEGGGTISLDWLNETAADLLYIRLDGASTATTGTIKFGTPGFNVGTTTYRVEAIFSNGTFSLTSDDVMTIGGDTLDFEAAGFARMTLDENTLTLNSGSDDPILNWNTDGVFRLDNGTFLVDETIEIAGGGNALHFTGDYGAGILMDSILTSNVASAVFAQPIYTPASTAITLNGLKFSGQIKGSENITTFNTILAQPIIPGFGAYTGTVTNLYGYSSDPTLIGGTVTNYIGAFLKNVTGPGGVVTNLYGIFIEEQTLGGTINNEIFIAGGGEIFFRDQEIHVGSLADGDLDLTADVTLDFNIGATEVANMQVDQINMLQDIDFAEGQSVDIEEFAGTSVTLADDDFVATIDDDTAGSAVTVNLPALSGNLGRVYHVKKLGTTANVILDGNGAETIDGAATQTISAQYDSMMVVGGAVEWHII